MPSPDVPEVLFTSHGYLVLQADVARTYFPGDTILALKRDRELWLLPTRGAAAGGLVLKQRNLEGDRSVLVREVLEDAPVVGTRAAIWDARQGVLRVALIGAAFCARPDAHFPDQALAAHADVEPKRTGGWLPRGHDIPDRDDYVVRHRIADYPTERHARIAARWIVGAASRDLPRPPLGF
jgi:hypothetical protein